MKKMYKLGGFAAIGLTLIYIIGIVMNFTMLDVSHITDPVDLITFMQNHEGIMTLWIGLLYLVFAVVLVYLTWVIYEALKERSPMGARLSLSYGLIWAALLFASGMVHNVGMHLAIEMLAKDPIEAGRFYELIHGIHIGLGGGNELPGGLWTLIISLVAYKNGLFKKWINLLGIIVGLAGLFTLAPPFFDVAVMIYAFGQMIWWLGLGSQLLGKNE